MLFNKGVYIERLIVGISGFFCGEVTKVKWFALVSYE